MPLDHEQLRASREERTRIVAKYGEVPTSIWKANYRDNSRIIDLSESQMDRRAKRAAKAKREGTHYAVEKPGCPATDRGQTARGTSVRGKGGGVSRFPANVCKRLILFYSEPGETIYDPCAGHNSRMQMVWEAGRNYIGYDISENYIELNRQVAATIQGEADKSQLWFEGMMPDASIELYCRDNCSCHLADNSIDFTFTSPPYWDLEFYGDEPEQLGWGKTYEQFLKGMRAMIAEQKRVLKPGRFCVLNVNDFRKEGRFYPYHADVIGLGESVGFALFDLIILEWSNAIRAAFASQVETSKIMPKKHEYLIVFRKAAT